MPQTFWVSTGDIREDYETINVVAVQTGYDAAVWKTHDISAAFRSGVDQLALQAQALGANGVIWIRLESLAGNAFGLIYVLTGTAVRVKPRTDG